MKSTEQFTPGKNNISWVSSTFKEHFHGMDFKEDNRTSLQTKKLPRAMNDSEIMQEMHPEPVYLGDVLSFLKTASHSEWYIFYVNDKEGALWAVYARWGVHGWSVYAPSVSDPLEWSADNHVVSSGFSGSQEKTLSSSDTLTLRVEKLEAFYQKVIELIPSLGILEDQ